MTFYRVRLDDGREVDLDRAEVELVPPTRSVEVIADGSGSGR